MRYVMIAFVILCCICVYLNRRVDTLKEENARLESEKNNLSLMIKEYKNAQMEADKTIKKLRESIKDNQENLDWYNERVPYDVLDIMQKQYSNNKAN